MKNTRQNLAMLSAVLAFAGCRQYNSNDAAAKKKTEIPAAKDTIQVTDESQADTRTIVEGKVLEVAPGKDGYTAKLETANKEIFFATVSHSNLKDHSQYKTVAIGDKLKVTGDYWKMENENHITVRELH